MNPPKFVNAAVEGALDEEVVRKLIASVGAQLGKIYGRNGKGHIKNRLAAYNQAAQRDPWLILIDLDHDARCPGELRQRWFPTGLATYLCFRVAVRAVESWLLADAETLADFLGISKAKVPPEPESLADPKIELINLARASRRKTVRWDLVPRPGSQRSVGPAYSSRLGQYVRSTWCPLRAAQVSMSLRRAIDCLKHLVQRI